jgi:hypothetical protein
MRDVDVVRQDEVIIPTVYQALAHGYPHSRSHGRPSFPAEVVLRLLKLLEEENARLKRLVAALSLHKVMLQDVVKEMYGPPLPCKAFVAVSENSLL